MKKTKAPPCQKGLAAGYRKLPVAPSARKGIGSSIKRLLNSSFPKIVRSANTLLEIPQTSGILPAGSTVPALLIEDLQGMPEPHAVDP
eukprot:scaffold46176_cov19-Tisochrysis_lutea.AAC.2